MKKSEAAKLLNKWINDMDIDLAILEPDEQYTYLLDFLVDRLGMLPPPAKLQKMDTIQNRVWEPEDENEK